MAKLRDIVVDCRHPASLARFWAAALDGYQVAPYDEAELERLRQNGIYDTEDDPTVLVEPTDATAGGGRPRLFFQGVPKPKTTKNRVHIDLRTTTLDEVERLVGLGAEIKDQDHRPDGVIWILLDAPEGNEFCIDVEPPRPRKSPTPPGPT